MKAFVIDAALLVAIASAWLGAFAFARLRSSMDRLHCVAFIYVGCGLPLVVAALVADGPSTRAFKVAGLFVVTLVAGASLTQNAARAIFNRDEAGERM